jgi:hypothetical protein
VKSLSALRKAGGEPVRRVQAKQRKNRDEVGAEQQPGENQM